MSIGNAIRDSAQRPGKLVKLTLKGWRRQRRSDGDEERAGEGRSRQM